MRFADWAASSRSRVGITPPRWCARARRHEQSFGRLPVSFSNSMRRQENSVSYASEIATSNKRVVVVVEVTFYRPAQP